jgi:segregation and condensation protein A
MSEPVSIETSHFFEVAIDLFEGPIDLLLHLVKREELPIERLSLAQITGQYFQHIERLRTLDFDVAGEYLVIAATLLSIKSSVLLNEPTEEAIVVQEGKEMDPHEELLNRLREAQVYRDRAIDLAARDLLGIDVFQAAPAATSIVSEVRLKPHAPIDLVQAFKKAYDRLGEKAPFVITVDPISIADRMMTILDLVRERGELDFEEVLSESTSVPELIASFCAILELCKRLIITVRQDSVFGQIAIGLADGNYESSGPLVSEFDAPPEPPTAGSDDVASAG